jgi:predicted acyltransferase
MRQITKDIEITIDGNAVGFRLTKLDAFSGVSLLRMLSGMPQASSGDSVMGFLTSSAKPGFSMTDHLNGSALHGFCSLSFYQNRNSE